MTTTDPESTPASLAPEAAEEATRRERLAALVEDRLDLPMAVLAVAWAGLVTYEFVAPRAQLDELRLVGNVIWVVFLVEFLVKLWISGRPVRFLRRHWPSVLFLVLPALRTLRVIRAVRGIRLLPMARVVGSSYRTVGTARTLLGGRLVFLVVVTAVVILSGSQLLYLVEGRGPEGGERLGETLWWAANLALTGTYVFEPARLVGRLIALTLSMYAVVVFASVAASLGAYFLEVRTEQT